MKFGKKLRRHVEEALPEWRDKYLCYKDLKKRLKCMPFAEEEKERERASAVSVKRPRIETEGEGEGECDSLSSSVSEEYASNDSHGSNYTDRTGANEFDDFIYKLTGDEFDFIQLLNPELEKFNLFFIEKEEEYIIRQKELQERIEMIKNKYGPNGKFSSKTKYKQDMMNVRKHVVNFHGEMVLLEDYSILNFTGLVKILKKYDKKRGGILRVAFIQRVLQQPFFRMELLFELVKQCEEILEHLFSPQELGDEETEEEESVYLEEGVLYKSATAALRSMRDMRKGSSTYGVFSLPPLSLHDLHFIEQSKGSTLMCPPSDLSNTEMVYF
uniref:SPX domain-containing protein n=1 Tax=Araucaria cunninghamii TaxID=56994 RepID=A0A0D6QTA9_ARACU